ncbi:MAG: glycosyltransferase family 4 protein [Planctomycetota bacterium]|nr:glycosyltransferase family 4 protein [Planctomycetota bacterium]
MSGTVARRAIVASSVGGGPMERLARDWPDGAGRCEVHALYSPERYRALMAAGAWGRLRARCGAYLYYPLRVAWAALWRRPAVWVPTTNPFFLPFVLVATRFLHRQPVVALVYDLYPDALEAAGGRAPRGPLVGLVGAFNRFLFRRANGLVFIGERMAEHARGRYGEPRRWTILETGASLAELGDPALREDPPRSDLERWCEGRTVFSYVGNMGLLHDWETLARAAPLLLARAPAARPPGFVVAASGPGVERLREAWKDLPPEAVRFEPPLGDEPWARLLARSSVSLTTLTDAARLTCVPSKAFSAMAARNAVLAVAPAGSDLADLVERRHCGAVVAPGQAEALAGAMLAYLREPERLELHRARAQEAVREHYDMPRLAEKWRDFIDACTGRPDA